MAGGLALLLLVFVPWLKGQNPSQQKLVADFVAGIEPPPTEVELAFTGDLLIHTPLFTRAQALAGGEGYDFAPMFAEIKPLIEGADLAFCHLETPMSPEPPASYPIFNTPPDLAYGIAETGWDACSTASNHTLDQGEDGVGATLDALEDAGVAYTGSATSRRQSKRTLLLEAEGVQIAFLAYTSDTNGLPVPSPHLVNLFDADRIANDAEKARERGADAVIVNLHWASEVAPEYVSEPSPQQLSFARRLTSEPAITALVGQGPHVSQPIQRKNGKVVVFSEGNLTSNQGADTGLAAESQDGYIALLTLAVGEDGSEVIKVRYVPTWTDHADYRTLPVGPALRGGEADKAALEASYRRTVEIVGKRAATPVPRRLP